MKFNGIDTKQNLYRELSKIRHGYLIYYKKIKNCLENILKEIWVKIAVSF